MSILDQLGINQEAFDAAKSTTVTEAFEVMPSGVYDGKVKKLLFTKINSVEKC